MLRLICALSTVGLIVGCSGSSGYTGSYLGGDEVTVIQLDLVESGEAQLNGSIVVSELDYAAGRVKMTTKPITGVRDGKHINLRAHAEAIDAREVSLSLEAKGNSLFLKIPANGEIVELQQADTTEYKERLAALENQLNGNDVGLLDEE